MKHPLALAAASLTLTAVAVGVGVFVNDSDSDSEPPTSPAPVVWTEPYGGCDEAWQYPNTDGYRECKEHGLIP